MTTDSTNHAVCLKMAADLGRIRALDEKGLLKTAGILDNVIERGMSMWLPAGLGYVMGGPEHRLEGALAGAAGGHLGKRFARGLGLRELRKVVNSNALTSNYHGATDRALLRGIHADPIFRKNPELANMRSEFLPLLRQYEGLGGLVGGSLTGFGVGKALSSQDTAS
jgi:hypothetical protein